jgi:hypothetical protein
VIILEGPDGSGKTATVDYLSKALQIEYVHHSGGPWIDLEDGEARLVAMLRRSFPALYDRFPALSEYVYGPILRNKNNVSLKDLIEWSSTFDRAILIYVRPSMEHIIGNAFKLETKKHKPPKLVQDVQNNIEFIVKRYDEAILRMSFAKHGMRIVHYNWEDVPLEVLKTCVESRLESMENLT